jgi:hypothetical protein
MWDVRNTQEIVMFPSQYHSNSTSVFPSQYHSTSTSVFPSHYHSTSTSVRVLSQTGLRRCAFAYVRVIVLACYVSQITILDLFQKGTGDYESG